MKILPFQLPNSRLILLAPVSVSNRTAFMILLEQVKQWVNQSQSHPNLLVENEGIWQTIQSLIDLLPRKDEQGMYGFDLNDFKLCPEKLQTLITVQLDWLHEVPSNTNKEVKAGFEEFSLPSSGDMESDLIADLCQSLGEVGLIILDNYSLESVNNIIKRLNLTNLPKEKLEKLKQEHEEKQARIRFRNYGKKFTQETWKDDWKTNKQNSSL